jgi:hypothetical protein
MVALVLLARLAKMQGRKEEAQVEAGATCWEAVVWEA